MRAKIEKVIMTLVAWQFVLLLAMTRWGLPLNVALFAGVGAAIVLDQFLGVK